MNTETDSPRVVLSLISALGPVYDELPAALRDTLALVGANSDAELIVIEDATNGAVRHELGTLEGPIRVRHFAGQPLGSEAALASGVTVARGEILVFVAPEARLARDALDLLATAFGDDPGLALARAAPSASIGAAPARADSSGPVLAVRASTLAELGGAALLAGVTGSPAAGFVQHAYKPGGLVWAEVLDALVAHAVRTEELPLVADAPLGLRHWAGGTTQRAFSTPIWDPPVIARHPRPGINVVGMLSAACGIGDAGRRYIEAIGETEVAQATYSIGSPFSPPFAFAHLGPRDLPYDVNLLALNPEILGLFAPAAGTEVWRDRYAIGLWFWELEALAEQHFAGFRLLNELWVSSGFLAEAFARHTDRRVVTVPLPVRRREGRPSITRAELGLPDAFSFLTMFDFGSLALRKNSIGVIRAFTSAFAPGEGPVLVLKTLNAAIDAPAMRAIAEAAQGREDIVMLDAYYPDETIAALVGNADCVVSLHRSEGFGLTPADAMAWGRPVIATGYSGNLEFMNAQNSYLVDWDRVDVPPELWSVYPAGAYWAEPRIEHAAAYMRHVYTNREEAAARAARGQADIRRTNSTGAAAAVIAERLTAIAALRRRASSARAVTPRRRPPRRPVPAGRRGR